MTTGSDPPGTKVSAGQCPLLYVEGLLVRAFGEAHFKKHFEWLMRCDPKLGGDSYGRTIRLYVERVYVIKRDLDYSSDNWATMKEFQAYVSAIENVPDLEKKRNVNKKIQ